MKLERARFELAREYIRDHARPVDRALFEFWFESGSPARVAAELRAYQNEDGGFGRALEPDFRLEASSVAATTFAFRYLREVGASSGVPLVPSGIAYLVASYDRDRRAWPHVPPEVNEAPHAPWWHVDEHRADDELQWGNPNAEVVACLYEHAELVPERLLHEATQTARDNVRRQPERMVDHPLLCFLVLAEASDDEGISMELRDRAAASVPEDPAGYPAPFWFAPTSESLLADLVRDRVERSLDHEVASQQDDGSWAPRWSWDQYEDVWSVAEREWRGWLTAETLRALDQWGGISR